MARLGLRIAFLIIIISTVLLFYTGYHLQQQSLQNLRDKLPVPSPQPLFPPPPASSLPPDLSRASKLRRTAYLTTVESPDELCNAIILFQSLHHTNSAAKRILHYPKSWDSKSHSRTTGRLLNTLKTRYYVDAKPVLHPGLVSALDPAYQASELGKEVEDADVIERVLLLRNDGFVRRHFDEMLLKSVERGSAGGVVATRDPVDPNKLSSAFLLLTPSTAAARQAEEIVAHGEGETVERVVDAMWGLNAEVKSWRGLVMWSRQLRKWCRHCYEGAWDPEKEIAAAGYVNFGDEEVREVWKVLKKESEEGRKAQPEKEREREVWWRLREEWKDRREGACGLDLVE